MFPKIAKFSLGLLLIIAFTEPFGDAVILTFPLDFQTLDTSTKLITSGLLLITGLSGIKLFPSFNNVWTPFWIIFLIISFALVHGIISNTSKHALNDVMPFIQIFLILSLINLKISDPINELRRYCKIFLIIVLIKFVIYQSMALLIFGSPSWKILFRQSPFLLIPFSVFLNDFFKYNKSKFFLFLILFLLTIGQARMLIISASFVMLFHIFRRGRFGSVIFLLIAIIGSYLLYSFSQRVSIGESLNMLYEGDLYQKGKDYRLEQLAELGRRFLSSPIIGMGMGYFNPNYMTYFELAKPYQLELDILNFFSKIGILFTLMYSISYILLFSQIKKVKSLKSRDILTSYFIGLIGVIIYSLGQTAHQSYLYWLCYAIFYGYLILEIRISKPNYCPKSERTTF
jgi:hypothetical protein